MAIRNELTMPSTKLEITKEAYLAISNLLDLNILIEQVGICFGVSSQKKIRIEFFIEMENLDSSSSSFSIDYGRLVEYINKFQEEDKTLIGFFHSHPQKTPPLPSKKDESFMHLWPFPYIWLIGTYPKILVAFTLLEEKIKQLPFEITPEG